MVKSQLSFIVLVASLFAVGCSKQSTVDLKTTSTSENRIEVATHLKPIDVPASSIPASKSLSKSSNCHVHAASLYSKAARHCHPNPAGSHAYGVKNPILQKDDR